MRNLLIISFIVIGTISLLWMQSHSGPAEAIGDQPTLATLLEPEAASSVDTPIVRKEQSAIQGLAQEQWDPSPEVLAALKASFEEYHGQGGGEERIIAYQRGKLEGRPGEILHDRLSSFPERFKQAGLHFEASLIEMDGMLRVAGNHLSNNLNHQLDRYFQWKQEEAGDPRRLPVEAMTAYPLNYPPEMWFALQTGQPADTASANLLLDMALLRDRLLRQDALLYQEQYILDSSMTVVAQRLGEKIPAEQWPEVWSQLVPQYGKVLQEQDQLGQEYRNGLQALTSGR